jgi:hypothetical protein
VDVESVVSSAVTLNGWELLWQVPQLMRRHGHAESPNQLSHERLIDAAALPSPDIS